MGVLLPNQRPIFSALANHRRASTPKWPRSLDFDHPKVDATRGESFQPITGERNPKFGGQKTLIASKSDLSNPKTGPRRCDHPWRISRQLWDRAQFSHQWQWPALPRRTLTKLAKNSLEKVVRSRINLQKNCFEAIWIIWTRICNKHFRENSEICHLRVILSLHLQNKFSRMKISSKSFIFCAVQIQAQIPCVPGDCPSKTDYKWCREHIKDYITVPDCK